LVAILVSRGLAYCLNGGPISTIDSNIRNITLYGNTPLIYIPVCPGLLGVDDRTLSHILNVTAGVVYEYNSSLYYGTCNGPYAQVGTVWIDWNRNQVFEDLEIVNTFDGVAGFGSFSTIVPSNAVAGMTRMRLMALEGGRLPLDPCSSFNWGCVIDIGVSVASPSPTPSPTARWSIRNSFADGPGVAPDQRTNRLLAFTLWAMDENRNHVSVGGIQFTMVLYGQQTREAVPVNWSDYNDGSYGCRYTLTADDTYVLFISSGTEQISNSPFTITAVSKESSGG